MSAEFEKETASSTGKSLFGALVALGSGFVFMFLGLVAVTGSTQAIEGDPSIRRAVRLLQDDVFASLPGSLFVSPEKNRLRLKRVDEAGETVEVLYSIEPETATVTRSIGDDRKRVAKLSRARFETADGLVHLVWSGPGGERRASWALHRWAVKEL